MYIKHLRKIYLIFVILSETNSHTHTHTHIHTHIYIYIYIYIYKRSILLNADP